jgi:hypothetical protein
MLILIVLLKISVKTVLVRLHIHHIHININNFKRKILFTYIIYTILLGENKDKNNYTTHKYIWKVQGKYRLRI